ncbi:DUF3465 domain-containing protein [Thiofilum flexile]|uniref:DUF3465 domain-containing protein n=1 Tax=Thiofilum flexile TaxID=125627 RepID=UPI00038176FF|nr:DUF3465 domain-containing protein [Thiofilum flexile]
MPQSLRRWLVIAVVICAAIYQYFFNRGYQSSVPAPTTSAQSVALSAKDQTNAVAKIQQALREQNTEAKFWVTLSGKVIKLLKDDREGSMHQRFLIEIAPNITLLIAHNIDIAKRVPVKQSDTLTLRGEYVWNDKGGVLHWTHHDPKGRTQGGWIDYQGLRYQ